MARTHELKIWPRDFVLMVDDTMTFELRRNDRDFQAGDCVVLSEWDPNIRNFTGRQVKKAILHVLREEEYMFPGLQAGYAILGLGDEMVSRSLSHMDFRDKSSDNNS